MEKSLPVISVEEIEKCAEGKCCQCGHCCLAFRILAVPSIQGDINSPPIEKDVGQMCPQAIFDKGKYWCALQELKGDPRLTPCENFTGNNVSVFGNTYYSALPVSLANWIAFPESLERIENIRIQQNRAEFIPEVADRLMHLSAQPNKRILFFQTYFRKLRVLPEDIFDAFGLHMFFPSKLHELKNMLFQMQLQPDEDLFLQAVAYWNKTKSAENV